MSLLPGYTLGFGYGGTIQKLTINPKCPYFQNNLLYKLSFGTKKLIIKLDLKTERTLYPKRYNRSRVYWVLTRHQCWWRYLKNWTKKYFKFQIDLLATLRRPPSPSPVVYIACSARRARHSMAQRVEREKVAEEEGDLVNRQVIRGRGGLENDLGGRM